MMETLLYILVAFIAGIFTFLAPCTLPVLPAYIAYAGTSEHKKVTTNTLFFGFGLATIYTLLGVAAGTIGKFILSYKQELVYVFGFLLILFGILSITGKNFKLTKPITQQRKRTKLGAYLFGGAFGLTWSGCIGPVLGFMLILAANTKTMFTGGLLLFIYSLGLVFPLILFSVWLDKLPRDGKIWCILHGKLFELKLGKKSFYVHSTNILSGILFISLGLLFIFNVPYALTNTFPGITEFIFDLEDKLASLINSK
ncbi:hypothetical protein COV18_05590 [Candidatus Woesearchaeota archaeon CG10_big_fil_rev_8_21_14_0_10_37_12]|nr:MAG: hypothetical protein COV18_05590 [Candidatus Woesearchaeota archaeon CG10_big_fil_rev_8_21_14_0_10_37_12]